MFLSFPIAWGNFIMRDQIHSLCKTFLDSVLPMKSSQIGLVDILRTTFSQLWSYNKHKRLVSTLIPRWITNLENEVAKKKGEFTILWDFYTSPWCHQILQAPLIATLNCANQLKQTQNWTCIYNILLHSEFIYLLHMRTINLDFKVQYPN